LGPDRLYGGYGDDAINSKDGVASNYSLNGGFGTDTKVTDATEKLIAVSRRACNKPKAVIDTAHFCRFCR
jgi:hypothetical protein